MRLERGDRSQLRRRQRQYDRSYLIAILHVVLAKTIGLLFLVMLPMVSYTVYAERRVSAMIQDRVGPNRVGSR